jgi:uncharacterized surface protein with fasciclin (FAS1) repeats
VLVLAVLAVGASPASAAWQDHEIVDTATAAGDFATFTKLLKRAGLVNALKQPGPYTVFAPTDAAFAKIPRTKLNALLRSKKKLRSVLLYHVIDKKLTARQVINRKHAKTLNGKKVRFRVHHSNVYVNRARVTTANIGASNGVIHVMRAPLRPLAFLSAQVPRYPSSTPDSERVETSKDKGWSSFGPTRRASTQ